MKYASTKIATAPTTMPAIAPSLLYHLSLESLLLLEELSSSVTTGGAVTVQYTCVAWLGLGVSHPVVNLLGIKPAVVLQILLSKYVKDVGTLCKG
jgi:hypothetical protein